MLSRSNSAFVWAVHDGKGKLPDKHSPDIRWSRRTCERVSKRSNYCFFYRCCESRTETRRNSSVVGNFREKLTPRRRNEPRACHRENRRASANTSSAGYEGISPRSNAATRRSISSAQAASTSAMGVCKDSRIDCASFARSSGLRALACSSSCLRELGIQHLVDPSRMLRPRALVLQRRESDWKAMKVT